MLPHEVYARRDGEQARLECRVCAAAAKVVDGDFEAINDFLDAHRKCAEPGGTPSP